MKRNFNEHFKRTVNTLDGAWRFAVDKTDTGESERWFEGLAEWSTVEVPSVWNEESSLLEYQGVCWYEKEFEFSGGTLRLVFDAVMTYAKVWLDGDYLGDHYGGFTRFEFIAHGICEGTHRVSVRVDNRFDEASIPQTKVDWYHYGGIVRSVSAEKLLGACVLSTRFEYELSEDYGLVKCRPVSEIYGADDTETDAFVTAYINGAELSRTSVTVRCGETVTVSLPEFVIDSPRLWSPDTTELYTLLVSTETDGLYDRIGFRKVAVSPEGVSINCKTIRIQSVNRHDEYPTFGFAFPASRIRHDIELAENLGCNSIRGSHYPNSQKFVDYLDERGMTFWSEIPIWGCGFSVDALGDPIVVERGLNMHFGWYSGGMEAWDGFITDFCRRRDSLGSSDKPIIFSEFGAAALYGLHDAECPRWSEEYQAKLLRHCLTLFRECPEVIGSYVWQFCDIRTSDDMGYTRARGFNNNGILNEWRRPKASYYAVKECYTLK